MDETVDRFRQGLRELVWRGTREGRRDGRREGRATVLRRQIARRFAEGDGRAGVRGDRGAIVQLAQEGGGGSMGDGRKTTPEVATQGTDRGEARRHPGMLDDAKAWVRWARGGLEGAKALGLGGVVVAHGWIMDNILSIAVYAVGGLVSISGIRGLHRLATDTKRRLRALAPKASKALDVWHGRGPGAAQHFISRVISLTPHLEALNIPCPPEPPSVNDTGDWEDFLSRLLPLAELGRLEDTRGLLE